MMKKVMFKSLYKGSEWVEVGQTDKTLSDWIDERFDVDEDEINYFLSMGELKLQ